MRGEEGGGHPTFVPNANIPNGNEWYVIHSTARVWAWNWCLPSSRSRSRCRVWIPSRQPNIPLPGCWGGGRGALGEKVEHSFIKPKYTEDSSISEPGPGTPRPAPRARKNLHGVFKKRQALPSTVSSRLYPSDLPLGTQQTPVRESLSGEKSKERTYPTEANTSERYTRAIPGFNLEPRRPWVNSTAPLNKSGSASDFNGGIADHQGRPALAPAVYRRTHSQSYIVANSSS